MAGENHILATDGKVVDHRDGSELGLTPYHAQYFAYELTRKHASGSIRKLAASLQDAQVDMNPHQVEAVLFAFQSPLSKGALLADEVGLGKTIEVPDSWDIDKVRIESDLKQLFEPTWLATTEQLFRQYTQLGVR